MSAVYITAMAAELPNAPVSNDEMEAILGRIGGQASRARHLVLQRNGIRQRHYAIDKHSGRLTHNNAQLTAAAVRKLDSDAFSIDHCQLLACGTSSPDQQLPNHAVMVHGELGIPPCEVVASAGICTSGMAALKYAYLSVLAGSCSHAVATGSELASTYMLARNFGVESAARVEALSRAPEIAFEKDFLRWMLSDGAGAALLQNRPAARGRSLRIDWIELFSFANLAPACMFAGAQQQADGRLMGWREFSGLGDVIEHSLLSVQQDVKLLDRLIVPLTVEAGFTALRQRRGPLPAELDYFLPHLSSEYFRPKLQQGLDNIGVRIPQEKWFTNLASRGNTGAAAIYLMLEELLHSDRLHTGQRLLCFVPESGRFSAAFMLLTVV